MGAFGALLGSWARLREATARALSGGEAGQGYIEYAFILILMAMVVLVMLSVVGHETTNVFSNVSTGIAR